MNSAQPIIETASALSAIRKIQPLMAPGLPASMMNDALVRAVAPGSVTFSTTWKSLRQSRGVMVHRT